MDKNNKKFNFTDITLIAIGITTVLFIIAMIVTFWRFQLVPDTLINNYFKAIFGELSIAGILTWNKRKYNNTENDDEIYNHRAE